LAKFWSVASPPLAAQDQVLGGHGPGHGVGVLGQEFGVQGRHLGGSLPVGLGGLVQQRLALVRILGLLGLLPQLRGCVLQSGDLLHLLDAE
jgi:hypothetical protein